MKLVVARMNHETNSFSPLITSIESFSPCWGEAAYAAAINTNTAMGAFIDFANQKNADISTPVFAMAYPSGPVLDDAFEKMAQAIVEAVSEGCDAILLDLHGAMVTESFADAEGELLSRVRKVAPSIPIGVALDLHGNVTPKMVEFSDFIVGFKTYPHIDMYDTGVHVAKIMSEVLDGKSRPKQIFINVPILAQTLKMNTNIECAMSSAIKMASDFEGKAGVSAVTVFGGFPHSDLPEVGASLVVVGENEEQLTAVAKNISQYLWEQRADFIYHELPLPKSIEQAAEMARHPGQGPVLMLDHGDNCMSGGTCDTMDVLEESIRQGLTGMMVGPIADSSVVKEMFAAGEGAKVTVDVGNKWDLSKIGVNKKPLRLSGVVRRVTKGEYKITGPIYTGMVCSMGNAAVLETEQALILIVDEPHEPWDIGVFTCVGLDPNHCSYLILKSRMYCRPVFEPISKAVVECGSMGVSSSKFDIFQFNKINRPLYPLDGEMTWAL